MLAGFFSWELYTGGANHIGITHGQTQDSDTALLSPKMTYGENISRETGLTTRTRTQAIFAIRPPAACTEEH